MANYPSVAQVVGSMKDTNSGTIVDRAVSGKPRFRSYYSQDWAVFTVMHDCTGTEKDSILSHYATDAFNSFSFTWSGDSTAYTVRYANHPKVKPKDGDERWSVVSTLIEV